MAITVNRVFGAARPRPGNNGGRLIEPPKTGYRGCAGCKKRREALVKFLYARVPRALR